MEISCDYLLATQLNCPPSGSEKLAQPSVVVVGGATMALAIVIAGSLYKTSLSSNRHRSNHHHQCKIDVPGGAAISTLSGCPF